MSELSFSQPPDSTDFAVGPWSEVFSGRCSLNPIGCPKVVVIGGSVAGCLAAAATAKAGASVCILERDPEPHGAVAREGTPQANQLHGLSDAGRQAAESLLPGLSDDLKAHGSFVGDTCADVRWYHGGVWKVRTPIGKSVDLQTRGLFEWRVREAVANLLVQPF